MTILKSASEMKDEVISSRITVLHGQSGAGKSSLALTASKTNKMVYFDLEGVYSQIKENIIENINEDNIYPYTPKSLREVINFVKSPDAKKFDLLVIDSVSFLSENEFVSEKENYKDGRQLYGNLIDDMTELNKEVQVRGIEILYVCHSTENKEDGQSYAHYPMTKTQKLTANMVNRATNIMYIETYRSEEGEDMYRVICDRFSTYAKGKKRDSKIPNVIEDKNIVWQDIEKHFNARKEVSDDDVKELKAILKKLGSDEKKICKHYEVKTLKDLSYSAYLEVLKSGKRKIEQKKKEAELTKKEDADSN